jgi:hypothetical protein
MTTTQFFNGHGGTYFAHAILYAHAVGSNGLLVMHDNNLKPAGVPDSIHYAFKNADERRQDLEALEAFAPDLIASCDIAAVRVSHVVMTLAQHPQRKWWTTWTMSYPLKVMIPSGNVSFDLSFDDDRRRRNFMTTVQWKVSRYCKQ